MEHKDPQRQRVALERDAAGDPRVPPVDPRRTPL